MNDYRFSEKHCVLDTNWTLEKDGETYKNISLSSFSIPGEVKKGDVMEISTTLPDTSYTDPMLVFRIYLCAFDVYVDDEIVFSYGKNEFLNNRITGSGYNFISLSADSNGKELTIKVYVATDNSISSFSSIELDESRNCTRNFIYNPIFDS